MQVTPQPLRASLTEHLVDTQSTTQGDSGRTTPPGVMGDDQLPELLARMQELSATTFHLNSKVLSLCGGRGGALLGLESGDVVYIGATLSILGRHFGAVTCLLSLDGLIVSGSEDQTVKLWKIGNSSPVAVLTGHSKAVSCLATTPDRSLLVSGSLDLTLRVWSLEDMKEVACLIGHSHYIKCVATTRDGRKVISGSLDNTLIIWNLDTMTEEATLEGHKGGIWCLGITSEYVVSGSWDNTLKVWNLSSKSETNSLPGLTRDGSSIPISSDDQFVISGSHDNSLNIWRIRDPSDVSVLRSHTAPVTCVALTPDNKYLISGSEDCSLKVWSYSDREEIATLTGHKDWITSVIVTPDGKSIVSLSRDGTVKIWSLDDMKEVAALMGHSEQVTSIALHEARVVSASVDKTVKVWDLTTRREIASMQGHTDKISCIVLANNGNIAISGSKDATLRIWDLGSFTEIGSFQEHTGPVYCAISLVGSQTVASGSQDRTIKLWNFETVSEIATLRGHTGGIWCLAVSNDTLVSGSDDRTIKLWDLKTMMAKGSLTDHQDWVRCLALNRDTLISAAADGTMKVWSMSEERCEFTIRCGDVSSAALTPDCEFALAGGKVFSLRDMKEITCLRAHDSVTAVVVSADGRNALLASAKVISVVNLRFELQPYRLAHFTNQSSSSADTSYRDTYSLLCANIEKLKLGERIHTQVASHIVYPYFFNSLHVCAFYNHYKRLGKYLQAGVPFIRGQFGSPLTVALKRNTRKCVEVVLEYLLICSSEVIAEVTDDLPLLACSKSALITPFFETLLRPARQEGLPQFISPVSPLPIVKFRKGAFIRVGEFALPGEVQNAEVVEFQVSLFRWNFWHGSETSISFLRALERCPDSHVLTTELVTTLIEEKWASLWPVTLTMTALYILMLFFLVCLQYQYWSATVLTIAFLGLNCFFLAYEGVQSIVGGVQYWKDVWNCVDCVRGVIAILWALLVYRDGVRREQLQFVVVALCFIRGFTFFRTFKMTRLFVRMTLEVVKEIYSFLVILMYSTFAFGLMYSSLNPRDLNTVSSAWVIAYELIMGQFKNDGFNEYQWLCFTAASLLNIIIMLNLLISILGDAYERAQMSARENDLSEMLHLMLEYESMLFWRRHSGYPCVLVKCSSIRGSATEDEWEGRVSRMIKGVKEEVTTLEIRINTRLDGMENRFKGQMDGIEAKVDTILKAFTSL